MKRNHTGHRVGECHHRAKLTDAQVKDIRQLYAEWKKAGGRNGYCALAEMFECGISTVRDIVQHRTRQ